MKFKILFFGYIATLICLFLYTFTQVDLSLTLSQASIWQEVQKNFQYIGFFQRPLSATIFSVILFLLFLFYIAFLLLAKNAKLSKKQAWSLVIGVTAILGFSYNAFSYDLFSYIFDAKIITFYGQNPFLHKPLDFAGDPMLSFMRWTHRIYPYGPSWLFLTVPLSFIGMNYFLPTLILFKALSTFYFLGGCFLVYKISEKLFPKQAILSLVFWSLNPLVIIEGLISSHNDMVSVFSVLLSFYLFIVRKKAWSALSYLFSVGVKYGTVVLLPIFPTLFYFEKTKKNIPWEKIFLACFYLSIITTIVASLRTTFQPWYLLYFLPFSALLINKYYIFIFSFLLSLCASLIYIPYVYLSDYAPNYPQVIFDIEFYGLIATIIITMLYVLKRSLQRQ